MPLLGVISDTHGLLRPEAVAALAGVDLILHAGDVGSPAVLEGLRAMAPVIAVRGNVDRGEWATGLPETEVVTVENVMVYMLHDLQQLDLNPAGAGVQVVISGHSHRPAIEERQGVLYLNPGSAGPQRFTLPICLAHLNVQGGQIWAELIELNATSYRP